MLLPPNFGRHSGLRLAHLSSRIFPRLQLCSSAHISHGPRSSKNDSKPVSKIQEELEGVKPDNLIASTGGFEPPEENMLAGLEEGYGYFTAAAVGYSLDHYGIIRKLGWAGNSTVWLGYDRSAEPPTYVAIKFLTIHQSLRIAQGLSFEYDAYRKIESANPSHPGFKHCLILQRCFPLESAAGNHICFITDVLSSNLLNLRNEGENPPGSFTLPIVKRVIKQVLLALDYLHRECGYIHADIKADNILAKIPPPVVSRIQSYIGTRAPTIYGPPLRLNHYPIPLVFARTEYLPYLGMGGSLEDISVCLVDYGEAIPTDHPKRCEQDRQPDLLRAPEVTLGYPWSTSIDIWTVGCLFFSLLTDRHLLGEREEEYSDHVNLQRIAAYFGPFPERFLNKCTRRASFFAEDGTLLRVDELPPTPVETALIAPEDCEEQDIPGVANFPRRCFTIDPELRPSAQELLQDKWLMS